MLHSFITTGVDKRLEACVVNEGNIRMNLLCLSYIFLSLPLFSKQEENQIACNPTSLPFVAVFSILSK